MSGVGRRLFPPHKRRRWARDVRANMQIVEVMVVGLMVVGAVVAVSTMEVPVSRTEGFKETNENLVKDALGSMAQHPSAKDKSALFGSVLEEYVMEAIAGNPAPLMGYLNKTLPAGASYNVLMDNGYGPPVTLVDGGKPPREAVAGSIQFVPKLAYTFMISDFAHYQGDFQMNVHALPIANSVLLHDEGESIEVAVTFHDVEEPNKPVTVRSYGHTALRQNDPLARSWPSVSMYHDVPQKNHYIDKSGLSPWEVDVPLYGELVADSYNISFPLKLEETAGVEVPKGAQIRFQFPRLWEVEGSQRTYMETSEDLGNAKFWKDFEYEGNWTTGQVVKARLKAPYSGGPIWFNMSASYLAIIDSAHPHFGVISVSLGDGAQGTSSIVIKQPGVINVVGSLRREPFLSVAKPLISDDTSSWGVTFINKGQAGDEVKVDAIEIRQPQGKAIFDNLVEIGEFSAGDWQKLGPAHYKWTPSATHTMETGQAAWWSFSVEGGHTNNNNYRNENYLNFTPVFNPENTTSGSSNIGEWEFAQRAFEMWEEWIYRVPIAPSDGDPHVQGLVPGWPDERGYEYWVTGGTTHRNAMLPANFTYDVTPFAASSGYFGDYQGSHVFSQLDLVDALNKPKRDYALGDKVRIKNDFSAVFGELSSIDGLAPVSVTDLRIDTYVYTPEKAWKGVHTEKFSEDATMLTFLQDVRFLERATVADEDTQILIAVDSGGLVYGMDATDGTKFWVHDTAKATASVAVVDLDGDGTSEALIGSEDGTVTSLDVSPTPQLASGRVQWSAVASALAIATPSAIGLYDILDMVQIATKDAERPELAIAASPDLYDSRVYGLDVSFDGTRWSTAVHSMYQATETNRSADVRIQDLQPIWIDTPSSQPPSHVAVASDNRTVFLLDATDLTSVTWITDLVEKPYRIHRGDLDGDGADDLVVNTYEDSGGGSTGIGVVAISGRTGNWGATVRPTGWPGSIQVAEASATSDGGVFAVAKGNHVMQDNTGLYQVGIAWPSLENPLDLGNIAPMNWNGLDTTPDDTAFVIEDTGEIRRTTDKRIDGTYDWTRYTPEAPVLSGSTFVDVHVGPDWATGDRVHALRANGEIRTMDDAKTYVLLASVCTGTGVPDAGVACGGDTKVERWRVQEDADGNALAFFVIVNDAETLPDTGGIYRYDVATQTWSTVGTWAGKKINDFHIATDGTYHVGGHDQTADLPWLERKAPSGSWVKQSFTTLEGMSQRAITSVLMAADGSAYASSDWTLVWRHTPEGWWAPVPVTSVPGQPTKLVETADGKVWIVGHNFAVAPLHTYQTSSWAYFPLMHDDLPPGEEITKMEIKVTEGHTGSDPTGDSQRTLTEIVWWYKSASVTDWTRVPVHDPERVPFVDQVAYNVTIDCPVADACEDVQLRAELNNRVISNSTHWVRRDGGASPLIRDVMVTFYNGFVPGSSEKVQPSGSALAPGSTAVYSAAQQGFVSPMDPHRGWMYLGKPNYAFPATGSMRMVAVSTQDLVDGSQGVDVVMVESGGGITAKGYVLDGLTGGVKRPATGTTDWVSQTNDETDVLRVMDVDGDTYEEIVGGGRFDGVEGSLRIWDVKADTIHTTAGDGGTKVYALAPLDIWNGKPGVVYVSQKDLINAYNGPAGGSAPVLRWTNDPSVTQGKATFVYPIGLDSMYGTGIVVSELVFKIDDNGNQITQTARLMDWFNITPPNEEVPNPPIYTVEIVSWFNEA